MRAPKKTWTLEDATNPILLGILEQASARSEQDPLVIQGQTYSRAKSLTLQVQRLRLNILNSPAVPRAWKDVASDIVAREVMVQPDGSHVVLIPRVRAQLLTDENKTQPIFAAEFYSKKQSELSLSVTSQLDTLDPDWIKRIAMVAPVVQDLAAAARDAQIAALADVAAPVDGLDVQDDGAP